MEPYWVRLRIDLRKFGNAHQAALAREGDRLVMALRLRDAEDPVIAGIVQSDLVSILDRQPLRLEKHA